MHQCHQLKSLPELYEGYVPMAYDHYLQNISKYGSILRLNFVGSLLFIELGLAHIRFVYMIIGLVSGVIM